MSTVDVDMRAVCEALGFDPTNHHNAAKCPYCRPADDTHALPQAHAAKMLLDMTATGRKRINAAAVALSEVMAFVKLDDDLAPKVRSALSGLCAMQALAPQADAAEPVAKGGEKS